jgi:hypothetical protein
VLELATRSKCHRLASAMTCSAASSCNPAAPTADQKHTHKRGEPQWPKWLSQRCSQTVSWETKDICQKRVNHKAQVWVMHARFTELSVFQQDQIGHGQMPTSIITFDHVQSWCNHAAANNRNTQPSTTTMAKCRSQRHSQTVQ